MNIQFYNKLVDLISKNSVYFGEGDPKLIADRFVEAYACDQRLPFLRTPSICVFKELMKCLECLDGIF